MKFIIIDKTINIDTRKHVFWDWYTSKLDSNQSVELQRLSNHDILVLRRLDNKFQRLAFKRAGQTAICCSVPLFAHTDI